MDAVDPGRMVYVYHRYLYYECEDRIQHPMGRRLCDRRMRSGSLYRCDHLVRQKACGGEEGKSGIQRKEEKMIEKLSRNGGGALRMTRMPAAIPAEFFCCCSDMFPTNCDVHRRK